jgi:hypothetical protein
MKKLSNYLNIPVLLAALFITALAGQAFGQKTDETKSANTDLVNLQAGNVSKTAMQSSGSTPNRLTETEGKPIARTTFVKRVNVKLNGTGASVVAMQIPAGKRLVIENVSAIVRSLESQQMELNYFTYTNSGGGASKSIQKLALQKQASFRDSGIFTANQKVTVFADEQIGDEHFSVGVSARFKGGAALFTEAQFTFSGYLEDLPTER